MSTGRKNYQVCLSVEQYYSVNRVYLDFPTFGWIIIDFFLPFGSLCFIKCSRSRIFCRCFCYRLLVFVQVERNCDADDFTFNYLFKIDKSGGTIIRFQILACISPLAAGWLTVLSLAWHDEYTKYQMYLYIGNTKTISQTL